MTSQAITVLDQWEPVRPCPVVFTGARGAELHTEHGRTYLDFSSGALPLGHHHPHLTRRLTGHGHTGVPEREFLDAFRETVLAPRELPHTPRFCGVTGAVAVARAATGRRDIVPFAGAAGSLDGLERTLAAAPAAVLVEPVRGAEDLYPATLEWLRDVRELTERHGVLLICDESRTGCGRTGPYFGFEDAGVVPDVVVLSDAVSCYGLPLAVTLSRPELDVGAPGTFRGDRCALVTATAALEVWRRPHFRTGHAVALRRLDRFAKKVPALDPALVVRGRGLMLGIDTGGAARAERVRRLCFDDGLIVGRRGRDGRVVAVLPPLTIDPARHDRGLAVLERALCASV